MCWLMDELDDIYFHDWVCDYMKDTGCDYEEAVEAFYYCTFPDDFYPY